MVKRKGCGKMRHVRVGMLWVQDKQATGELNFKKVHGLENPGDLTTKYLSQKVIDKLTQKLNQNFVGGRAESGLRVP